MKYEYMKESEQMLQYFQFPKFLLKLRISQTAKFLYMILYDRARISRKNSWIDKYGNVYLIFPIDELSVQIDKCKSSVKTALKELDDVGLLVRRSGGFSKPNHLYVKIPSDARYRALDAQYAKEQDALEIEIAELEKAVTGYEQSQKSAEKFIALIDKYENFDTLTNTMLNEFVEKILVHERARKGSQDTTQEIEIYFNFLGRYIPPSLQPVPLTPEKQEELQKKEERKDRLHQNYLKRKASGAQKQYEDKIKAKKKAEMDAKKALIRAEDMKKGVFSTIGQLPKEEPRKGSIAASAAV